jgi:hypothetical protein
MGYWMLNRISVSSSKAEGIGLAVSNIRSRQSNVGKSNGKAWYFEIFKSCE